MAVWWSLFSVVARYLLDSCEHHCGGWNAIRTDDGRSQRQAFEEWYNAQAPQPQPQQQQPQPQPQQQQPLPPQQQAVPPKSLPVPVPVPVPVPLLPWGGNNTAAFPCVQCCGGWVQERQKHHYAAALRGGSR
jgi:hypothetical protein